jgi:3-carboxy-cis,cis-muconate cycloisomerase
MAWDLTQTTLRPFFSSEAMAQIFSDKARIQAMLDVEAALARMQAGLGIIPEDAAAAIAEAAWAEHFDIPALAEEVLKGGNLAIPLVKALTDVVAASHAEEARWVHWGATSQDIIDTGLVLQMREALTLLDEQIDAAGDRLAALASAHAETPMVARSLMQQAVPTTLGLRIAGWLSALTRAKLTLAGLRPRVLVLQFGGAAGNLASLAPLGPKLAQALAEELGLGLPDLPWHTQRDRIAETGAHLAILLGILGKIGGDLAAMSQSEIGEFREASGEGRGGSSAMPHKANPVGCGRVIAAAARGPSLAATLIAVMGQEHERGLGTWHAEWEVLPDLFRLASAALEAALAVIAEGEFDVVRLRANLETTGGLVMAEAVSIALGRMTGKAAAHKLVEEAARRSLAEKRPLKEVLAGMPEVGAHFTTAELDALFAPESHLGAAAEFTGRAVDAWRLTRRAKDTDIALFREGADGRN